MVYMKVENDKQVRVYKTKWFNKYVCADCGGLDTFDGAYIVCKECGGNNGAFKSARHIYKKKWFFFREIIETEVK